jgi:hypothetical protein
MPIDSGNPATARISLRLPPVRSTCACDTANVLRLQCRRPLRMPVGRRRTHSILINTFAAQNNISRSPPKAIFLARVGDVATGHQNGCTTAPAAGVRSIADPWDPSSAGGLLPPVRRLIFNFHRHDAQLGIKTAVPQLRPPACVPLLTRGGPSSAGSLLPPAGRLLFNFHGPDAQLGIKTAVSQLRPPACVPLLTRGGPSSAGGLLPPAGRLLSNFHGPGARFPAGMPWSGHHVVVAPLQLQGW